MLGYIYEMPVYDGRLKEWRVLNILTGSIYSGHYDNMNDAYKSINEGELRTNRLVKAVTLAEVKALIDYEYNVVD